MADKIRPAHYKPRDGSAVDCSRAQQAGLGKQGYQAYLAGCAAKYLWRFPEKNGREDLQKCIQILNMLLDTMPAIHSTEPAKNSEEKVLPQRNFEARKLIWQEKLLQYLKKRPNQFFTVSCIRTRFRRHVELRKQVHFWLNQMVENGMLEKHTTEKGSAYFGAIRHEAYSGMPPILNYK
jgi:hypothetical protein